MSIVVFPINRMTESPLDTSCGPRNTSEVLSQPLYPFRSVDHGLDTVAMVLAAREIFFVGSVIVTSLDTSILPATLGTDLPLLVPGLFHGIVSVFPAEDRSKIVSHPVTIANIAQNITFQVCVGAYL